MCRVARAQLVPEQGLACIGRLGSISCGIIAFLLPKSPIWWVRLIYAGFLVVGELGLGPLVGRVISRVMEVFRQTVC